VTQPPGDTGGRAEWRVHPDPCSRCGTPVWYRVWTAADGAASVETHGRCERGHLRRVHDDAADA